MALEQSLPRRAGRPRIELAPISQRAVEVAVQGTGAWVRRTVQRELREVHHALTGTGGHAGLQVTYVGIEPTAKAAKLVIDPDFETYLSRDDDLLKSELQDRAPDIVIIASPDHAHIDDLRKWLAYDADPRVILIEKPLSNESFKIQSFMTQRDTYKQTPIFGLDHYIWYIQPYLGHLREIDDWIGQLKSITFFMTETNLVEAERLSNLGSGMSFDMGAHLFGVLALFCDLDTCTDLRVGFRGRHVFKTEELRDRRFFAETSLDLSLRVHLRGQELKVPVYSRLGKGANVSAKFIQFSGKGGRFARIDFSPPDEGHERYPYQHLFTGIQHENPAPAYIVDPLIKSSYLELAGPFADPKAESISRGTWRAHGLVADALAEGSGAPFEYLLKLETCYDIVQKLEDIRDLVINLKEYERGDPKWKVKVR